MKKERLQVPDLRFRWNTFRRSGVWYADGRGCRVGLGRHSLGTRNLCDAKLRLAQLDQKKAVELGLVEGTPTPSSADISIQEGWSLYLADCLGSEVLGAVSKDSHDRYNAVRKKHYPWCRANGIETWQQCDSAAAKRYGKWLLQEKYADPTIGFEITLLKTVVKWLAERGMLPAGTKIDVPVRKVQESTTYCYTREEVRAMVEHCRLTPDMNWMADVMVALATTGARISELEGLRWRDVDLAARTLSFRDERSNRKLSVFGSARRTKGGRSRVVPINAELMKVLQSTSREDGTWVFRAMRGGPLRQRNVLHFLQRKVIPAVQEQFPVVAGDPNVRDGTTHGFRHFFCSESFAAGVDEAQIQEWMGHKSSQITRRYRHRRRDHSQRKMEEISFLSTEQEGSN